MEEGKKTKNSVSLMVTRACGGRIVLLRGKCYDVPSRKWEGVHSSPPGPGLGGGRCCTAWVCNGTLMISGLRGDCGRGQGGRHLDCGSDSKQGREGLTGAGGMAGAVLPQVREGAGWREGGRSARGGREEKGGGGARAHLFWTAARAERRLARALRAEPRGGRAAGGGGPRGEGRRRRRRPRGGLGPRPLALVFAPAGRPG